MKTKEEIREYKRNWARNKMKQDKPKIKYEEEFILEEKSDIEFRLMDVEFKVQNQGADKKIKIKVLKK